MSNEMIATANPKTLARREQMRIKYNTYTGIVEKFDDISLHPSQIDLTGYHTIREHNSIITYETEIEGLFCDNPELLYRNANNSPANKTCKNIYWNCNDCMTCDKRRRLKIMKHLDKRFRYHTDLNKDELYVLILKIGDNDPAKLSKKIKYIQGKNNQLLWFIKDTSKDYIRFLMQGKIGESNFYSLGPTAQSKITRDEVIDMISIRDKYRMLGLFYNKVPDVEFAGMTEDEIHELSKVKAVTRDRCGCGELMSDHTIRKAKNMYDFDMYVEAEEFYEEEHIKFKKKYNI